MVLLDRLVVVPDGPLRHRVHVIGVVKSIMLVVVTGASNQDGQLVQVAQLSDLYKLTLGQNDVHHLHNVGSVQIVVVSHILKVVPLDSVEEVHQLLFVELVVQMMVIRTLLEQGLADKMHGQVGQSVLTAKFLGELENVEVGGASVLEEFAELAHVMLEGVHRVMFLHGGLHRAEVGALRRLGRLVASNYAVLDAHHVDRRVLFEPSGPDLDTVSPFESGTQLAVGAVFLDLLEVQQIVVFCGRLSFFFLFTFILDVTNLIQSVLIA